MYYAHSLEDRPESEWQTVVAHLLRVSKLAAERGDKFRAGRAAALAGILHDLGKYSEAFQRYIRGRGPSPDHSTAGAKQVLELAKASGDVRARMVADVVAYLIAGHHGGLPDRDSELNDRLRKEIEQVQPVWKQEIAPETGDLWPAGFSLHPDRGRQYFQLAFLGRMIFSCLIDADRLDTETFVNAATGKIANRSWPILKDIAPRLVERFDAHMAEKRKDAADTDVNRLRNDILAHVCAKASMPRGVFTLSVPTGGGKTLASLAFALEHARHHGMDRIITAIPFTSVIDQTAKIFRDVLETDDAERVVLEHHSAIDLPSARDEEKFREGSPEAKLRLAMEDWAAPVVVTTNVQFFESLFSHRTSRCRKLHNLANAVIVLDEAQTIPRHLLRPCVAALDELCRNYGCTVVLCTATQPALAAPEFEGGFELRPESELAPDPKALHEALRRTEQHFESEPLGDEEIVSALADHDQALVIVNSRGHALELYEAVKAAYGEGVIHLTTRQTAAERRAILAGIRKRLDPKNPKPCRVVATSLVEAGVDLDFPRVWRAEAGLDQIAQAAGRCNREGRRPRDESIVTVFRPAEAGTPSEIKGLVGDMDRILGKHEDVFAPDAMRDYFGEVYWRLGDGLDRIATKDRDGRDVKIPVLGAFRMGGGATDFAYRTVGEGFRMIESGMAPVVIARADEAKEALAGLRGGWFSPGSVAQRLQSFIVQVPPRARKALIDAGRIEFVEGFGDQFAVLVSDDLYSPEVGLLWENPSYMAAEGLCI